MFAALKTATEGEDIEAMIKCYAPESRRTMAAGMVVAINTAVKKKHKDKKADADALMEKYFEEETLSDEEILCGLKARIARGERGLRPVPFLNRPTFTPMGLVRVTAGAKSADVHVPRQAVLSGATITVHPAR